METYLGVTARAIARGAITVFGLLPLPFLLFEEQFMGLDGHLLLDLPLLLVFLRHSTHV